MSAFDHDDVADLDVADLDVADLDVADLDVADLDLDPEDVEQLAELTDEDLAAALDWLHERNPLDGYGTPVTRPRKPNAAGRRMEDLPPL
ncbi:hypothetical protein [Streptomyces sp. NBC_00038]|uniref:hypothetical protein n=1 Tax=Streptomyces sp. NBC_00038 TaxID=2903615 RepID=UPI002255C319|nr:hypothetical protein [Streptomyces sp. NBC_00038]MCX5562748.1 hypothetical protein [Streptomyces sp. NBC_00038]MCX5563602.1 hypothetical protein [Streptomyces sp. NBC_00038]